MINDREAQLVELVIAVLKTILRNPARPLTGETPLAAVWGFDSHTLYRLITELENAFNVELDASLIVPETFATPVTIAKAFASQADSGTPPLSTGGSR
jgi:acyl carrier protein